MRKVWTYKRKRRPGVYVMWYDAAGKQRSRRLPNQKTADLYRLRREHELNADLYNDPVAMSWDDLRQTYLDEKQKVSRLTEGSLISIRQVFNLFEKHVGKPVSTKVGHVSVKQYVEKRTATGTSPATVNKDLRTLRAFVNWAIDSNYMGEAAKQIHWHRLVQAEEAHVVKSVTVEQFAKLLATAESIYGLDWRIRLLLAIATGLRLRDVERIQIEELDLDRCSLMTRSKKTGKAMAERPIHATVIQQVRQYIEGRSSGRILVQRYHHSKWERIREAAGMPDLTYHALRKSFSSWISNAGFSIAVVQDLLEHSSAELTRSVYLDTSPVHRAAAQAIPIDAILTAAGQSSSTEPCSPEPPLDRSAPSAPPPERTPGRDADAAKPSTCEG